ncbi:hypothetical protein COB87_002215 [Candidatus Wolfebacteria bacterium]|nr:hypothetical protein [Candidatus Wolfebacteria bacterium]
MHLGLKYAIIDSMHQTQEKILSLLKKKQELRGVSLRQIAVLIGIESKPQIIKHHLTKLSQKGLIQLDLSNKIIKLARGGISKIPFSKNTLFSLPVIGAANCGPATIFAEEYIQGYLKVSSKMLPRIKKGLYVVIADGDSMNKEEIQKGEVIESGDFVLVDSEQKIYRDGEVVVAVIDGLATIKKYREDKKNKRIILEANSTSEYFPIYICEQDEFQLSGKVVGVIKRNIKDKS